MSTKKSKKIFCDLCSSTKFKVLINKSPPSMSSDRKSLNKRLKKIECQNCGLVFNGHVPESKKILGVYEKKYSYNTGKEGEVFFFNKNGFQGRSSQIFEWILENIPRSYLIKSESIVEFGCGQGNLLSKLADKFPDKVIVGYEFNSDAIKIGKEKGLDIRNFNTGEKIMADIVISFAVIEHTTSPKEFLKSQLKLLKDDGILIIGLPNQDKVYYDILFNDHIFHFSSKHIEDYGKQLNLVQFKKSKTKWPIDTFSLHCFRKGKKKILPKVNFRKTKVRDSILYYERVFQKINEFLKKSNNQKNLSVFGLGETFSLFYTYTDLKKIKIHFGIEDFPVNENIFPFPIIKTTEIKNHPIGALLVCVNQKYYSIIRKKIKGTRENILFPFEKQF